MNNQNEIMILFLNNFKVNPDDFEEVLDHIRRHYPEAAAEWRQRNLAEQDIPAATN